MRLNMRKGRIVIDGKEFHGSNITVDCGGKVTVDGVAQDGELVGDINITVYGDVESLDNTSGDVTCKNVGSVKTVSGDIDCDHVSGSVKSVSGDVKCAAIQGNVNTVSGDIIK